MTNLIFSTKSSGKTEKIIKTILKTLNTQTNNEILFIYDVTDNQIVEITDYFLNYLNHNSEFFFTLDEKYLNITCRTKHSTILNFSFITQTHFLQIMFNNTLTRFHAKNYQYYCVYEDVDKYENEYKPILDKFSKVISIIRNMSLSDVFSETNKELIIFITYSFEETINMKTFSKYKLFQYFMQQSDCFCEYHEPILKDKSDEDTLVL